MKYRILKYSLIISKISVVSVVMFSYLFLILLIWFLVLSFDQQGQRSMDLIYRLKEQALSIIDSFCIFFFVYV